MNLLFGEQHGTWHAMVSGSSTRRVRAYPIRLALIVLVTVFQLSVLTSHASAQGEVKDFFKCDKCGMRNCGLDCKKCSCFPPTKTDDAECKAAREALSKKMADKKASTIGGFSSKQLEGLDCETIKNLARAEADWKTAEEIQEENDKRLSEQIDDATKGIVAQATKERHGTNGTKSSEEWRKQKEDLEAQQKRIAEQAAAYKKAGRAHQAEALNRMAQSLGDRIGFAASSMGKREVTKERSPPPTSQSGAGKAGSPSGPQSKAPEKIERKGGGESASPAKSRENPEKPNSGPGPQAKPPVKRDDSAPNSNAAASPSKSGGNDRAEDKSSPAQSPQAKQAIKELRNATQDPAPERKEGSNPKAPTGAPQPEEIQALAEKYKQADSKLGEAKAALKEAQSDGDYGAAKVAEHRIREAESEAVAAFKKLSSAIPADAGVGGHLDTPGLKGGDVPSIHAAAPELPRPRSAEDAAPANVEWKKGVGDGTLHSSGGVTAAEAAAAYDRGEKFNVPRLPEEMKNAEGKVVFKTGTTEVAFSSDKSKAFVGTDYVFLDPDSNQWKVFKSFSVQSTSGADRSEKDFIIFNTMAQRAEDAGASVLGPLDGFKGSSDAALAGMAVSVRQKLFTELAQSHADSMKPVGDILAGVASDIALRGGGGWLRHPVSDRMVFPKELEASGYDTAATPGGLSGPPLKVYVGGRLIERDVYDPPLVPSSGSSSPLKKFDR